MKSFVRVHAGKAASEAQVAGIVAANRIRPIEAEGTEKERTFIVEAVARHRQFNY